MKSNLKGYAENALFALSTFIVFLLIFENQLRIPFWMQPLGRMHPLVLHFPIVILLLALVLEFFRFNTKYRHEEFYQVLTSGLWLSGLLFSALTIIMGLFLSQEGGYAGASLSWHKWLGIGMLFGAAAIYRSRNARWYTDRTAKACSLVTAFSLLFAGHYGAVLTHGQNFILEPVTVALAPAVPLEEALVFDHLIQPIFEKKCISCHNPDKEKGQLLLTDAESIREGGKTGKLWVAGQPEMSLLLQRIHLPEENKKHMPPAGKTQLSDQERALLSLWIKGDADFSKKVVDLPASDSLRMLAAVFLKPAPKAEINYDFAAADEKTIARLNTNYRLVAPLAAASPALAVNIYNKKAFSTKTIADLLEVKQQIVSLDLNKMPVKDADLKNIGQLQNLRRLILNFTDVSGKEIGALSALPYLESLALSGTAIRYQDLKKHLPAFKSLRTLTLWNTPVTAGELTQLQKAYQQIQFIGGFKKDGAAPIKLNPPQLRNPSPIFSQTMRLQLHHPIQGATIRYTTDGSEPDSLHSPVFKEGTTIGTTTKMKAKAYKPGWYGSETAVFSLYKSAYKPDSVRLVYPLNQVHQANGAKTFFDGELGGFNANSPAWANNWAGFFKHEMALVSEFRQPILLQAIGLNTLIESENNIFPPATVEVWGGTNAGKLKLMATFSPAQPDTVRKPYIQLIEGRFKPQQVSYLKIVAKPLQQMPEWHPRKGQPTLLLIDELFFN
jgi:uncharacterized membrane protein